MEQFCDVFVIGGDHHNTLGVIRSLGYAGIRPFVVLSTNSKHPYVSYSKYIKEKWNFNSDDKVISFLKSYHGIGKPVVIACSDSLSYLLDQNYNVLSEKFQLPGSERSGKISYYMNKELMAELARKVGFKVPKTEVVTEQPQSLPDIPFPWIIKPLVSCQGSKQDIRRCFKPEDWENYIHDNHCSRLQVQQLIEKDYEFQLIGCSLEAGEILIIPGYAKNIRPSDVTNTGFLRYIPTLKLPVEESLCKEFVQTTGYSGLFSLEFIHGKDGNDYFMEMNFRNDGNSICVTAAGINLPYIWVAHQAGMDIHAEIEKRKEMKSVYVMPEFDDLIMLLRGHVSVKTWLKDLIRTDCFMEFSKRDIVPFVFLLRAFIVRAFKFIKKKYVAE